MGYHHNRIKQLAGSIILLVFLFASKLTGGWIEEKDGRTIIHIKVYSMPTPGALDPTSMAEDRKIKDFKRRFVDLFARKYRDKYIASPKRYGRWNWERVEVELHPFTGIQVEGVEADLLAIAGDMAPDVIQINFRKSDTYIRNSFLYPLDKPEDGYFSSLSPEEIEYKINPKLWPVIKRKGPDGQTHVWALPMSGVRGKVLLFRKDIFDDRNVDYPSAKWDWDDLLDAARKITDPEKGIYGIALGRGNHESWFWANFLWSAGGDVMEYEESTDQWRCCFDSDAAVEALDFYIRLSTEKWTDGRGNVRRGYAYRENKDSWVKWYRGEIGMIYNYIDEKMFTKLDPGLTGIVPTPLGPDGTRAGEINCAMAGLFSGIKEPAVRDAAWEYLAYKNSIESDKIWTDVLVENGMGQFVNPKYLKMFGYDGIVKLCPKEWGETFDTAIETGIPEPYGKNSNVAYDLMTIPIVKAEQMERDGSLPTDKIERHRALKSILEDSCRKANEKMIGIIPSAEKKKRSIVAYVAVAMIMLAFLLVFKKIIATFSPPRIEGVAHHGEWCFMRYKYAYALLLPAVLSILLWSYFPLLRGSLMAFQDYKLAGDSPFIGIDNVANVIFSFEWWNAVYNSFRYSFLIISLTFLPPIILAILLQEVPKGKLIFRLVYYLPAVVSGVVTTLLWRQFYEPSEFGALNMIAMNIPALCYILLGLLLLHICLVFARRLWYHEMQWQSAVCAAAGFMMMTALLAFIAPVVTAKGHGITAILMSLLDTMDEPCAWLINSKTAMLSCVIPMVWAGVGPGCLIYLAALKGVPDDLYEAADMDGAGFCDKIIFVVFPILKPLIIINFVGVFINSMYSQGYILAMTGGGANTEVAGLHIWYTAFTFLKFGPATAMAWMLGTILIGFTVFQLRMLSRLEFRTTGDKKT